METHSRQSRTVLWWSRSGREYSRNRVIRGAFRSLDWQIRDFAARISAAGDLEAAVRRLAVPDLVWVPCFRQRELAAAARFARRRGIPVVFDPLISAWDKQVSERQKLKPDSAAARRLLRHERALFRRCDLVIADTACHADFFRDDLGVNSERLSVIPVGAEEDIFRPQPCREPSGRLAALFYGSFIGLQGPEIIAKAATLTRDVDWTFVGDGPLKPQCEAIARECDHIRFLPWVPYESLPDHIAAADVVLGVFGSSDKSGRVIPNKVFQALACGRTVVTRPSAAYPPPLQHADDDSSGIIRVPPGDARVLADTLQALAADPARIVNGSTAARATFVKYFSERAVSAALDKALQIVLPGAADRSGRTS